MMKYIVFTLWLSIQGLAYANQANIETQLSSRSQLIIDRLKNDIRQTMEKIALLESKEMKNLADFSYKLVLAEHYQVRLGLVLEFDNNLNAFRVLSVSPNSLAGDAGIKVNDKIFSVNLEAVNSDNSESILQYLQQLEVEEELTLAAIISGKRQELTIVVKGIFVPKVDMQFGCCIFQENVRTTQQTKPQVNYAAKTKQLINKLALTIQSTVAVIAAYEKENGKSDRNISYKIFMPATSKTNLGLSIKIDDISQGIVVQSVAHGSIAEQVNIVASDIIVRVNDLHVNEDNKQDIISQLQTLKTGDNLLLSVQQQDETKELTLEIKEQHFPEVNINVGLFSNQLQTALGDESKIPAPFRGENNLSGLTIDYHRLNKFLNLTVVDMGRSGRIKARKTTANMGTRLKNNRKRLTTLEGNRFYFEAFKNEENRKILHSLRVELESLPAKAPLYHFSKKEQLAYWLNLYNVTVLETLVALYPKKQLASLYEGDNAFVNQKILKVANIPLSLNDIKNVILKEKYNHDPDVLYGLYQGYIGAPDIRNQAYTSANVYNALKDNAENFANSNRGTYSKNTKTFYISSFYLRNADYFPDFDADVRAHILKYLEGYHRSQLEKSSILKANISNWRITDVYGSVRRYGGANNTNVAAMLGAVNNPNSLKNSAMSSSLASAAVGAQSSLLTPEQSEILSQLQMRYILHAGKVTVTDLEPSSDETPPNKTRVKCSTTECQQLFKGFDLHAKRNKWASYYVSLLHFNGIGTEQSTKRALFRLNKVLSRNWRGYLFGYGEVQNIKAKTYYQLGYIYLVDDAYRDVDKAISNLTKASAFGDDKAILLLGLIYLTDNYQAENSNLAEYWLALTLRETPKAYHFLLSSYGIDSSFPDKGFDWQIEQLKQAFVEQKMLSFDSTELLSSQKNIENMQTILAKIRSTQRRLRRVGR